MGNNFKPKRYNVTTEEDFIKEFMELFESRTYVVDVWVEKISGVFYICIDLNGTANFWNHHDIKMKLKRENVPRATMMVDAIWRDVLESKRPGKIQLSQLFGMLDPGMT